MKYGLSLSACIRDMAKGHVNPKFVVKVVAGTAHNPDDEAALAAAVERYKEGEWSGCGEEAERIFWEFWNAGKIVQPRLLRGELPDLSASGGHWVDSYEDIQWIRDQFLGVTMDP